MTIAAYRDRTSGAYPITFSAVRQRVGHMLMSDMQPPEPWVLDEASVDPVLASDQPAHDASTHSIAEGQPEQVDGEWRQTWALTALPPPPPPPPITIPADVLFFEHMTDAEYDDLDASIRSGETARVYRGWMAATSFTEGTAMWTLLDKHLSLVVTTERKAELLARPAEAAAFADEAIAA